MLIKVRTKILEGDDPDQLAKQAAWVRNMEKLMNPLFDRDGDDLNQFATGS